MEGARTAAARALLEADREWHTEAFALIELTNILSTAIRVGRFDLPRARAALLAGGRVFGQRLHVVDHADVLTLARRYRISGYDARYVALAAELGVRLVTEDASLRRAAPPLTQSVSDALAT